MTGNIVSGIKLSDGYIVETVYYGSGTLCISSQVGCAIGCPFCASGMSGLIRNLSVEELDRQVDDALEKGYDIKRVTISGIGEPLHNFDNVKSFIENCSLPVSVTTTGVVPDKLSELMNMNHNGVMLSLHAGRDETYGKVIPANRSLSEIISSLREIWKDLSRNKKRKTGFNYMLLDGLNDSDAEVEAFCKIISEFKEGVTHLLVCNDVEGSRYEGVSDEVLQSIYQTFREKGLNVRRANGWRRMREGGCGTLFAKEIADE